MAPDFVSSSTTSFYYANVGTIFYPEETYAQRMMREADEDYARRRAGVAGQVPPVDVELASDPMPRNELRDLVVDAFTRSVVRRRRERRPRRSLPGARR